MEDEMEAGFIWGSVGNPIHKPWETQRHSLPGPQNCAEQRLVILGVGES